MMTDGRATIIFDINTEVSVTARLSVQPNRRGGLDSWRAAVKFSDLPALAKVWTQQDAPVVVRFANGREGKA